MSYVRWGPDSDVYVYAHVGGGYRIETTRDESSIHLKTREECLAKLTELRGRGLMVPEEPLERLRFEIDTGEDFYEVVFREFGHLSDKEPG